MNGSGQRTIPNVVFPFRSMISKSFSVADNGLEYQVRGNLAPDISRRELAAPPGIRASIPTLKRLKTSMKNPLLKWDRVFPCPEQSETERNISWDIMSQLIFSVVCSPFRKRASNMPSAADLPGRSGRSRFRPAAGRFGKALHHGDEISGAALCGT